MYGDGGGVCVLIERETLLGVGVTSLLFHLYFVSCELMVMVMLMVVVVVVSVW